MPPAWRQHIRDLDRSGVELHSRRDPRHRAGSRGYARDLREGVAFLATFDCIHPLPMDTPTLFLEGTPLLAATPPAGLNSWSAVAIASVALTFALIGSSPASAVSIWQIGIPDESRAEFPVDSTFTDIIDYDVGTDPGAINAPNFPGYLFTDTFFPITTRTARVANIRFTTGTLFDASLLFGRGGAESVTVLLDGVSKLVTKGQEGSYFTVEVLLGDLDPGDHTLTLRYDGGSPDNGSNIDFLLLTAIPEPSTALLMSLGLIGLGAAAARRPRAATNEIAAP